MIRARGNVHVLGYEADFPFIVKVFLALRARLQGERDGRSALVSSDYTYEHTNFI